MSRPTSKDEFESYYRRDEIASRYDEQRSRSLKHKIVRAIEKDFFCGHLPAAGTVLEIGVGTGEIASAVCQTRPMVGIDTSPAMLHHAAERLAHAPVRLIELSMFELDSLNEHFSMVYTSRVFLHLAPSDLAKMLTLCANRLEPGGVLLFDLQRPNLFKAVLDRLEPTKMFNFRYSRDAIDRVISDEPRLKVLKVVALEHMLLLAAAALLPNTPRLGRLAEQLLRIDAGCAAIPWSANRWGVICERI